MPKSSIKSLKAENKKLREELKIKTRELDAVGVLKLTDLASEENFKRVVCDFCKFPSPMGCVHKGECKSCKTMAFIRCFGCRTVNRDACRKCGKKFIYKRIPCEKCWINGVPIYISEEDCSICGRF